MISLECILCLFKNELPESLEDNPLCLELKEQQCVHAIKIFKLTIEECIFHSIDFWRKDGEKGRVIQVQRGWLPMSDFTNTLEDSEFMYEKITDKEFMDYAILAECGEFPDE